MLEESVVDRVYKSGIPQLRVALEDLERRFTGLGPGPNWTAVRVRPLLRHAKELERLLRSQTFSREFSRLSKGVELFHSVLVYLRTNVRGLTRVLDSEMRTKRGHGNRP